MAKARKKPTKKAAIKVANKAAARSKAAPRKAAQPVHRRPSTQKARQNLHESHPQKARDAMTAAEEKSGYNASSKENTDPQTHGGKRTDAASGTGLQQRNRAGQRDPRGAGSGENANIQREKLPPREAVPAPVETTEYPKGEVDKGRIDPEAQAEGIVADIIPMRDRRAYLIDQAEKNEAANDELNAIQTEQNRNLQFVQNLVQDPDVQRENSMESAIADLEMHDPARAPETIKAQQEFRAARDKAAGNDPDLGKKGSEKTREEK